MSRDQVFLAEVSRDFVEGYNYYESLSPGRGGARFEAAFKRALKQVDEGVIMHFQAFEHFHRVFLPGFPYNLYYRLVENRAVITGVLYARSDPARIQKMLRSRTGI